MLEMIAIIFFGVSIIAGVVSLVCLGMALRIDWLMAKAMRANRKKFGNLH